jgi:hypothetical protein
MSPNITRRIGVCNGRRPGHRNFLEWPARSKGADRALPYNSARFRRKQSLARQRRLPQHLVLDSTTADEPRRVPHFDPHAHACERRPEGPRFVVVQAIDAAVPENPVSVVYAEESVHSNDAVAIFHSFIISNGVTQLDTSGASMLAPKPRTVEMSRKARVRRTAVAVRRASLLGDLTHQQILARRQIK